MSKTTLTGKHNYCEFKQETVMGRVNKMVSMRSQITDVDDLHVRFSYGNRKTGSLVPSVSLIPVADCGCCKMCFRGCYDVRSVCCYTESQKQRANNSAIAHRDPDRFFREVSAACKFYRFLRFFIGGDILNYEFFEGMVRVAKENCECQILAFTKMHKIVNLWMDKHGELPANLHIIFSEWKDFKADNPHNLPTSIPVWPGDEPQDGIWCNGNCSECAQTCTGCWSLKKGEKVLFEAH